MMATVANGGTLITPHLARAFDAGDGKGWQLIPPPAPRSTVQIAPDALQAVRDGLWRVVNGQGTGGRAKLDGRDVSGKTGTAQVVSLQNKSLAAARMDVRDHGWFVFFAPRDNPKLAGVIFAEHGEHGASAAPIARHVIDTYFAKAEGRPLPPSPLEAARLASAVTPSTVPAPRRNPSTAAEPAVRPVSTPPTRPGRAPATRTGGDD
jgi:penicillin-binding protein 2